MQLADWFAKATQQRPQPHRCTVNTTDVTAFTWGSPKKPTIILLHGGFANSAWYAHIAPHLAKTHFVIALDFSGHGHSDWRQHYTLPDFIAELHTLYTQFPTTKATLIGHSFGARIAYHYANIHPDRVDQLILLDPPNIFYNTTPQLPLTTLRPQRFYPSAQEILRRFRLIPSQPILHPFITDFVALHAITQTEHGYRWRTDLNLFNKLKPDGLNNIKHSLKSSLPVTLIHGQHSTICLPKVIAHFQAQHPSIKMIMLPNAFHALMLDQPLALLAQLQQLCTT